MAMTQRIEQYLNEYHVPYEVVNHHRSSTSLHSAHAAQVSASRTAKAVLLEGDDGYMVALVPADKDIRLGLLNKDFDEHLHLADETTVRQIFPDCDPGAVPSLPSAWGLEMVWDNDLLAQPDIYLEAGDHQRLIHVQTRYLREVFWNVVHCHFCGPRKMH
jgi:Ala-tRNA(Pro) deacylase